MMGLYQMQSCLIMIYPQAFQVFLDNVKQVILPSKNIGWTTRSIRAFLTTTAMFAAIW